MQATRTDVGSLTAEHREFLFFVAFRNLRAGAPREAADIYSALIAVGNDDIYLHQSFACALIRCHEPKEALLALDRIHSKTLKDPLTWLFRGQALAQLGQLEESAQAMRIFIRLRSAEIEKAP